jgi:hypothetical protein
MSYSQYTACACHDRDGQALRPNGYGGHMWVLRGNFEDYYDENCPEASKDAYLRHGFICLECDASPDQLEDGFGRDLYDAGYEFEGTCALGWLGDDGAYHMIYDDEDCPSDSEYHVSRVAASGDVASSEC